METQVITEVATADQLRASLRVIAVDLVLVAITIATNITVEESVRIAGAVAMVCCG